MIIFNGKKAAEKILIDLKGRIKKGGSKPKLAVISTGINPASELFIRNKKRAAKNIGIQVVRYKFQESAKEREIIKKIERLNADFSVNGIIIQLPLIKNLNQDRIINAIHPEKDIDGFHRINRGLLQGGMPFFAPPLPLAVFIALKAAAKSLKRKKILAIVNSEIFGETLKNYFEREKIKIEFFLRNKVSLPMIKSADIIITVCGCPNLIRGDMIKKWVILIDGGIVVLPNGKVVGDIDRKSVEQKAAFLTPVPGGIGPLTVALLLKNVYLAERGEAERRLKMKANSGRGKLHRLAKKTW